MSGASVKSGVPIEHKFFKNFEQKYVKSEKNLNFGLNLAENGLS